MRLLGIATSLLFLTMPLLSYAEQSRDIKCDSTETSDLLYCTSQNLKLADEALNLNYEKALASSTKQIRIDLRNTQRSWLRFRDSYCKSISDEIDPGKEAGIEETSCLGHLTADRATEIERLYMPPNDDQYFQLISSLERAGYDRVELLSKLQQSDYKNTEWVDYLSFNCNLLKEVNEEPLETCTARNNIYRSY